VLYLEQPKSDYCAAFLLFFFLTVLVAGIRERFFTAKGIIKNVVFARTDLNVSGAPPKAQSEQGHCMELDSVTHSKSLYNFP